MPELHREAMSDEVIPMSLSICIPTYNFGRYIGETLQSILSQITDDVKVVIVDGASTDETEDVVGAFAAKYKNIDYHRLSARGGIDRDMNLAIQLGRSEYCWLFSSDDIMRPGAVKKVLQWVQLGQDLHLCRHSDCTLNMEHIDDHRVLNTKRSMTFDLTDESQRLRYFRLAQTTEAFFSFMGTLIVKRTKWLASEMDESFVGSCWAHVARMFSMMQVGLSVAFHPDVLVDRRGDNDSFRDSGIVKRYAIAIEGYHRIASEYLTREAELAFHVRRVVRNEFGFRQFMVAAIECRRAPSRESSEALQSLIEKTYTDAPLAGWTIRIGIVLLPSSVYLGIRRLYRLLRSRGQEAMHPKSQSGHRT